MRRALKAHRKDFVAILVLVAGALAVAGYILYHQPSFTFGQSYYTVRAEFASSAAVTPGQGQAVTIAGVQVGLVGGVQLENGRAVVTMNIFKKYAPIYQQRDRAAAPAHAAEGHVPVARSRDEAGRRGPGRRDAGRREHDPGRRSRPDPGLARLGHAQLSAVAAVGGSRRVPGPPVQRSSAAGHVQAVRAARPRHANVRHAARRAQPRPPPRDPQPPARGHGARRRRRPARLADPVVEHELRGDLVAGQQPRGGAVAAARDAGADEPDAREGAGLRGPARSGAHRASAVRPRARAGAQGLAAAVPRHDARDPESAAAVLDRGPAARESAEARGHAAVQGGAAVDQLGRA